MGVNEWFHDDSAFLPIGSLLSPPYTAGILLSQMNLLRDEQDVQLE